MHAEPQIENRRRWPRHLAVALALFVVAMGWFRFVGPAPPDSFEIDEAEWVASGIFTWQLATTGLSVDFGATPAEQAAAVERPWRLGIQESTFGWMYPALAKLAFGAAASAASMDSSTRRIYPRFHPDGQNRSRADVNRALRRFLPAAEAVRLVTISVAAAIGLALFAIARTLAGSAAGSTAYILWLASPTARTVADYIRTDLFPILFGLLALLLVAARARELAGGRGFGRALAGGLALGLLCGAAVGSKLNGALVSFAVPLWLLMARLHTAPDKRRPWIHLTAVMALTAATCATFFWLMLPGLWGEPPFLGVRELVSSWQGSLAHMVRFGPEDLGTPAELWPRLGLVFRRVFFGHDVLNQLTGAPIGLLAAPLGALLLLRWALVGDRPLVARQILVYLFVIAAGTSLWIPHDRPRFFLPLLILTILAQAAFVGAAAQRLGFSRQQRATESS